MNELPPAIQQFLQQQTVMSIAALHEQDFWAANCFYVFDPTEVSLIFFSSLTTKHAQLLQRNPLVVGTVATQTADIRDIEGIQFKGQAHLLEGDARQTALTHYYARYPFARVMTTELWKIQLNEVKHTSNKTRFAQKTYWVRKSAV